MTTMNLPNKITMARIVMILLFLVMCNMDHRLPASMQQTWRAVAFLFSILAGLTDVIEHCTPEPDELCGFVTRSLVASLGCPPGHGDPELAHLASVPADTGAHPITERRDEDGRRDENRKREHHCDGETNESGDGCVCVPDSTQACYTGPANTQNVGQCSDGVQTCNSLGTEWGPCVGDVLPGTEDCSLPGDENCHPTD